VVHIENKRIARLSSAPYSRPSGIPEICCGQEMEFRKVVKRRGPRELVKLRCRLTHTHGPDSQRTKIVAFVSIPGVVEVMYKDAHRFIVSYFMA
jgi:hypothetical protein